MKFTDYQGKVLLNKYQINIPEGYWVKHRKEMESQLRKIQSLKALVKDPLVQGYEEGRVGKVCVDSLTDAQVACEKILSYDGEAYVEELEEADEKCYLRLACEGQKESVFLTLSNENLSGQVKNKSGLILKKYPFNNGLTEQIEFEIKHLFHWEREVLESFNTSLESMKRCLKEENLKQIVVEPLAWVESKGWVAMNVGAMPLSGGELSER